MVREEKYWWGKNGSIKFMEEEEAGGPLTGAGRKQVR
jgi:hypothetical protein